MRAHFRSAVVFGLGFFALTAQTLLLRDFLTVFEGSELAIGCFFGSWLLWVAVGALVCRMATTLTGAVTTRRRSTELKSHPGATTGRASHRVPGFELLPLLYVPVFAVQHWLILSSRTLSGIAPYELFPLARLVPLTLLINAPVSFVTGFLFTLACQWKSADEGIAVARVYMFEALGSFAGGVVVTLLLAAGLPEETLFFICAVVPALGAVGAAETPFRKILGAMAAGALVAALLTGVDDRWREGQNRRTWARILPVETYEGAFTTPTARYLYGTRQGQLVVMSRESIHEVVPATEYASEVLAVHLSQKPDARRLLVLGSSGLSICTRALALPEVESTTWLAPDTAYPSHLTTIVPPQLLADPERLRMPEEDARAFLADHPGEFDLVIVNVPDATSLGMCRFGTREFFELVRAALREGGIVGASVSGGENFMGSDLASLGASLYHTMGTVFAELAIKPGDQTWILGSNEPVLTEEADELMDRFAGIEGASAVFPPEGLRSLYPLDRIVFQRTLYETRVAERGENEFLNSDRNPRALSHALLVAVHQSGTSEFGWLLRRSTAGGVWLPAVAVALYTLLRLLFRRRRGPRPGVEPGVCEWLDSRFLIFSSAAAGMSLSIYLMFMLQMRFGSLFLYVGLVSSLFMLGLYCGSRTSESLLRRTHRSRLLLLVLLLLHLAVFQGLLVLPIGIPPAAFGLLFVVCGMFGGVYVPLMAESMRREGLGAAAAGAALEIADHTGGAIGGLLTGVVFLPVLGGNVTLFLLAALVAVNGLALIPGRAARPYRPNDPTPYLRSAGYVLAGLALLAVFASHLFRQFPLPEEKSVVDILGLAERIVRGQSTGETIKEMRPGRDTDLGVGQELLAYARRVLGRANCTVRHARALTGQEFTFVEFTEADKLPDGFFLTTDELGGNTRGYNGPLTVAVAVDAERTVRAVRIVRSRETPSYHRRVAHWCPSLIGRDILELRLGVDLDAVSGATISCRAITRSLMQTGILFDRAVLRPAVAGRATPSEDSGASHPTGGSTVATSDAEDDAIALSKTGVPADTTDRLELEFPSRVFLGFLVAALLLRVHPYRRLRRLYLLCLAAAIGFGLNIQYSMDQVLRILNGDIRELSVATPFLVLVGVPSVVLLFGNVYCGYLCPFGAIQELAGDLRPQRWQTDPGNILLRYGRAVKYVLLFGLMVGFALSASRALCQGDPLVTAFAMPRGMPLAFVLAIVALSFVYRRFWCRSLCPVGAFLSVLNAVKLLRPFSPAVRPGRCDLGVERPHEMDCIACDRCRFADSARVRPSELRKHDVLYLFSVAATAVFFSWLTFRPVESFEPEADPADPVAHVPERSMATPPEDGHEDIAAPSLQDAIGAEEEANIGDLIPPAPDAEDIPPRGKPRDADMDRLRELIDRGRLSPQEAKYYEKLVPVDEGIE